MKSKIERMKTTGIGVRGIAMVLFFVMLLTAIGSGSVLSAIALEISADDYGNAVQAAATEALGIAEDALVAPADTEAAAPADDEASKPDLSGFEENEIIRGMKQDIADTGASVDLAETGYSNAYLYYTTSSSGTWNSASSASTTLSSNSGTISVNLAANTTYRFVITAGTSNSNWWGNNSFDLSSQTSQTKNLGSYFNFYPNSNQISNCPNTLTTSTSGSYSFAVTLNGNDCSLTVSGGSGGGGGGGTVSSKVYFVKPATWTNVYAYFYNNSGYWDDSKGSGSSKASANLLNSGDNKPGVQMTTTTIDGVTYYVADCPANTAKISFVKDKQDNYDNFWETEAVYASFDGTKPIITPTSTSETKNNTKYYTYTSSALPAITTPTITIDGSSSSSVTASTTVNSTVAVTNVNSYDVGTIFKLYRSTDSGSTYSLVDSNTVGTFTVSRNTSTAGTYKVVAVPGASDTSHSDSADSSTVTLTVTKVSYPAEKVPAIDVDKTVTSTGSKVTVTVTNYSDIDLSNFDLKLYRKQDSSSTATAANITSLVGTVNSSTYIITVRNTSGYEHYKVVAVAKDSTVYSDSAASNVKNVNVQKASYYLNGDMVDSSNNKWNYITSYPVDKFYSSNVFYRMVTVSGSGNHYFRLLTNSNQYPPTGAKDTLMNGTGTDLHNTEENGVALNSSSGTNGAFYVSGAGTYFIFINQSSSSKKVWVRTDLAQITISKKYQTYNKADDTYSTGSTTSDDEYVSVNVDSPFIVDKSTTFSVTANVEKEGYEFAGWYSSSTISEANLLTTSTTLTVTGGVTDNTNYYPVVREKMPKKSNVVVDKNNTATVKATWNGITIANGRTLANVPAGATVTISGDANTGYKFKDTATVKGIKVKSAAGETIAVTGTTDGTSISSVTFTMPDTDVTITANTDEYWGADDTLTLWYSASLGNPGAYTGSTWSKINAQVYVQDGHHYVKIPASYFSTTTHYFALSDDSTKVSDGKMSWTGDDTDTNASVATGSEFYMTADEQTYEDKGHYWYRFSKATLKNNSYSSLIDYVLLDVTSTNSGKTGVYTYSVVLKETSGTQVSFIAKDGPARKDVSGSSQANDQMTLGVVGSTKVTATGNSTAIGSQTTYATFNNGKSVRYYSGVLTKGTTYKIRTTVSDNRFYVKAFLVNGVTVDVLSKPGSAPSENAEYSCDYTVPSDAPSVLEITPVYFHYNDANCVTFYLDGYDDVIQEDIGWGNTPYIYPYYATQTGDKSGGASAAHNAFGAYAGQPMIEDGGSYYTQIPLTDIDLTTSSGSENGTNIKGITISNGWYDPIHRDIMGWPAGDDTYHLQTYDYDDFQKIFVEKNPTNIYYEMKLREERDNAETYRRGDVTTLSSSNISDIGSNGNGWNLLKDKFNRTVDIFGTPLTNEQINSGVPLYVISTGYRNNIAGDYGTEWRIYKKVSGTYTLQTASGDRNYAIPPSLLFVNSADDLDNAVYPKNTHKFNVDDLEVSAPNDTPSTYKNIYTKLKNESTGVPVYITYEKNDRTTKSNYGGTDTTMYGPYRLDGRWYYTSANDLIDSEIQIEYIDGAGGYLTDTLTTGYKNEVNMGEHTGSYAYFTGEFDGKTQTGDVVLDGTKRFEMYASAGDGYEFVGWYLKNDKSYTSMNPSDKKSATASAPRKDSATYVARFRKLSKGSLSVQNTNKTGTAPDGNTYNGTGKGLVTVWYTTNGTDGTPTWTQVGATATSDAVTVGTDILSDANLEDGHATPGSFKLKVTLGNTPDGEDTFALYHNGYTNRTSDTSATTYELDLLDLFTVIDDGEGNYEYVQNTFTLPFYTYFNQHEYEYTIRYQYTATRLGNAFQTYTVHGTFDASKKAINVETVGDEERLKESFVESVRPTLSNFRKDMESTYVNSDTTITSTKTTYTGTVTYVNHNDSSVNTTLLLPYAVTNRAAGSFDFTPVVDSEKSAVVQDLTEGTILVQISNGYEKYITQNGTASNTASDLLTAPESLYVDESTTKHFQYWKVIDPSGAEVVRVYSKMFNYRLFDNYRLEPIYGATEVTNPNDLAALDQTDISISYLRTTRNQWNNTNNGGYTISNTDANNGSDILFNDFELNYSYLNKDIKTDTSIGNIGVVVEKIGTVEYDSNNKAILDMSYYSGKATDTINAVKAFAKNGTTGTNPMKKYTIDKNNLNNKNRVEFFYNTYNAYGDDVQNLAIDWKYTSNVKYNVYRAYTYMIVDGEAVISPEPAYFTMYGEAI